MATQHAVPVGDVDIHVDARHNVVAGVVRATADQDGTIACAVGTAVAGEVCTGDERAVVVAEALRGVSAAGMVSRGWAPVDLPGRGQSWTR